MNEPYVHHLLTGKVKQVGNPDAVKPMERQWESGMFKETIQHSIWLSESGLSGDEVADKKNHGGPEKAIFVYPIAHYDYWRMDLNRKEIGIGAMGENLAVMNIDESTICIGDTFQFGDAIIQVSQPRRPCWKPARRFKIMDFAMRIQNTGRTGWYFRVLQEGEVQAKQALTLLERPYPEWTVAKANEVMYERKDDLQLTEALASCELLAENWKQTLSKRLAGKKSSDDKRVFGPNKE